MGKDVKLIDSGECARDISVLLNYFQINRSRTEKDIQHRFYTTASPAAFKEIAESWMGIDIHVEHVEL